MKQFLARPRSIAEAIAWGTLAAIVVFSGLVAADFMFSMYRSNFGPVRQIDAIAVGNGYSISVDARPAHPMLAEYEQSVSVFGGNPREGSMLGRVEIPMNTGGRVRIGVLIPKDGRNAAVVLADRYATTRIDLALLKVSDHPSWRDTALRPLGIVSGESYPIKFIPCEVWPMLSKEERKTIIRADDELQGFCEAVQPDGPASGGTAS